MTSVNSDVDILTRPGGNDQVAAKKVLLAVLASAEADRLGIAPAAASVNAVRAEFLDGLDLDDPTRRAAWLADAGLGEQDFESVMRDLAAVMVVEQQLAAAIAPRVELHRRLMGARARRVAGG
ncbi:MAG: hypothetical protein AB7I01_09285 [Gammaproteobacteria bacterium]